MPERAPQVRDADLVRDRPAMLAFIMGLQHFEHAFEPNRRLDEPVAEQYLALLLRDVAEKSGAIFVAEESGEAIGWVVVHEDDDDVYVVDAERRYAYVSELFVAAGARGTGVGKALLDACEAWARDRGMTVMQIGVLPANVRAEAVYRRAGYESYALRLRKYLR